VRVSLVPLAGRRDRLPVDAMVLEKAGVFRGEDRLDEGGRDLPEADGAPVDRVALAQRVEVCLPGLDERGRLRVAPAEEEYLREGDEDAQREREEEEKREIPEKVKGANAAALEAPGSERWRRFGQLRCSGAIIHSKKTHPCIRPGAAGIA